MRNKDKTASSQPSKDASSAGTNAKESKEGGREPKFTAKTNTKKKRRWNNFMGISTDKSPNMLAVKEGLANHLQDEYPHILINHDYSHIFNLTAQEAVYVLPGYIMSMVKTISNYFSMKNITRRLQFCELQRNLGKHKKEVFQILNYDDDRFLSLQETVDRIIQVWECLKEYKVGRPCQQVEERPDPRFLAHHDLKVDFTDENRLSILVLKALLEKLSGPNKWFQDTNRPFPEIYEKLITVFSTLARIVTPEIEERREGPVAEFNVYYNMPWNNKEDIDKVTVDSSALKEKYLDSVFADEPDYFKNFSESNQKKILEGVKDFIVISLAQLKSLVPFNESVLKESSILYLSHFDSNKWSQMATKFKNIITKENQSKFNNELSDFDFGFRGEKIQAIIASKRLNLIHLRSELSKDFPLMSEIALALLILPYSTISVERCYSQLNHLKDDRRNKMLTPNVEGALLGRQVFQEEGIHITQDMLDRYSTMWENTSPSIISQAGSEMDEEEGLGTCSSCKRKSLFTLLPSTLGERLQKVKKNEESLDTEGVKSKGSTSSSNQCKEIPSSRTGKSHQNPKTPESSQPVSDQEGDLNEEDSEEELS